MTNKDKFVHLMEFHYKEVSVYLEKNGRKEHKFYISKHKL